LQYIMPTKCVFAPAGEKGGAEEQKDVSLY
jgi:hypothetical protein